MLSELWSPREALSSGNVPGLLLSAAELSHVPVQRHRPGQSHPQGSPGPIQRGLCCSRAAGETIPAARGEVGQGRRRIACAEKEFSTSSIGICRFRRVGRL